MNDSHMFRVRMTISGQTRSALVTVRKALDGVSQDVASKLNKVPGIETVRIDRYTIDLRLDTTTDYNQVMAECMRLIVEALGMDVRKIELKYYGPHALPSDEKRIQDVHNLMVHPR